MVTYYEARYHPPTTTVRRAKILNDYFGKNAHGVKFDNSTRVYNEGQVRIPLNIIFQPTEEHVCEWVTGYSGNTRRCTKCRKLERLPLK